MSTALKLSYPQVGRSKPPISHRTYARSADAVKIKAGKVARLVNEAFRVLPWLKPEHRPLVVRWAELEIVIRCAFAGLTQVGLLNVDNETREVGVKRLVHDYRQLVQTQTIIARELLLTPAVAAQLGGNSPVDLVGLMAESAARRGRSGRA